MHLAKLDSASLPADENELSRRYLDIVTRWIPIGMSVYNDWPVRPNCGHFFGGVYWYGLETSNTILTLAAAASSPDFDPKKAGCSADELRQICLRGLRYLLFTHDTGPEDCVRPTQSWGRPEPAGKKWGERGRGFFPESQCGYTVCDMVITAALIKDLLGDEERSMLAAVAADYLERFGEMDPKSGVYDNTQTEENAWTSMGLVAGLCVLPDIEDAEKLWHRAKLWMFRTTTVPQDARNTCDYADGKPVSAWCGRTFTTLPDYTAENHGFVHPVYMSSAVSLSGIAMDVLTLFGRQIPPQIFWRRDEVIKLDNRWCDGLGYPHSPQGMDWPYLRFTWPICVHSAANCYYRDSDAALLERKALEVLERSSQAHNGAMIPQAVKDHAHSVQDPMAMGEATIFLAAQCYLRHRLNGPGVEPSSEQEFSKRVEGTYVYPSGGIVLHNHARGISSFSWRNRTMVLPATREGIKLIGHSGNSVLGTYRVSGKGTSENLRKLVIRELPDRVSVLMIQDLAGDSIRRNVFFCSLPDGTGLSYEVAHALSDITVDECTLGYLQIMNDAYFGDNGTQSRRKLYWLDHEEEFRGYITGSPDEDVIRDLSGSDWVNVDDRMGFRFKGTGSPVYVNRHHYKVFHAVYDELILARYADGRTFKTVDKIAELALLWSPEQNHEATARREFTILATPPDIFAARVDGWICACNFSLRSVELSGITLEPMEPRMIEV